MENRPNVKNKFDWYATIVAVLMATSGTVYASDAAIRRPLKTIVQRLSVKRAVFVEI
jgi:hypothetical protein